LIFFLLKSPNTPKPASSSQIMSQFAQIAAATLATSRVARRFATDTALVAEEARVAREKARLAFEAAKEAYAFHCDIARDAAYDASVTDAEAERLEANAEVAARAARAAAFRKNAVIIAGHAARAAREAATEAREREAARLEFAAAEAAFLEARTRMDTFAGITKGARAAHEAARREAARLEASCHELDREFTVEREAFLEAQARYDAAYLANPE